jgi:asparagine synthase (glutamine-hydrolysing)
MCGISGGIGPKSPTTTQLNSQLDSLEHRGPDDRGTFVEGHVSLGMCRLAIVAISEGKQPASDQEQEIKVVFNGEIYNYKELRENLAKKGLKFQTSSESEVIIQLYLEHGVSFVKLLIGMFAIALYDKRSDELHLFRDRMGKKPLWTSEHHDGTLLFASEVRAISKILPSKTLRSEMITEVLQFGYVNPGNSTFKEINQLLPGSFLTWKHGKSTVNRYWSPNFEKIENVSYKDALERTKFVIETAVKRRLISERPIGSFLSGGFDSTIVTAYMTQNMSETVQTYSIGFKSNQFNEAHHARGIAKHLGTSHHEEIISADPSLVIDKISYVLDQPFADSSIIPTYLLSRFARENLVVALSGDGGDEIFGGYDRYLAVPVLQSLNPTLGILSAGLKMLGKNSLGQSRKIRRTGTQLKKMASLGERYLSVQSLTQKTELNTLLNPDFYSTTPGEKFLSSFNADCTISSLDQMVKSDLEYYLPGDILTKIDLASMANSLELRSPMLDAEVVEWGLSLPDKFKIKRFETKHILKDVARSLVPPELVDRPKMGFGIPRGEWLRNEMREMVYDILTDETSKSRGWFNSNKLKIVIDSHMGGSDKDSQIWPILMLELWARNWLD